MEKNKNLIHIENLYKSYGSNLVLDNVDLSVREGEFCTLVGPSGCGKSTLLRLILGQESPSQGSVLINGNPSGFPNPERGIVFQKYSLMPNLTVLENVLLGKRLTHQKWWWPKAHKPEHIAESMHYLEQVRLENASHKYPHELSGGMQQRAAIAQALIMKPPMLLMDEPFGALDPDTREDLQLFLMDLWEKESLTIFFVTHDLEEACFLGSRLLVLSQYYTDDRGGEETIQRGGKLVCDFDLLHNGAKTHGGIPTTAKNTKEFKDLIELVRKQGFNPEVLQHVDQFNLHHQDSFQTLTHEEHNHTI